MVDDGWLDGYEKAPSGNSSDRFGHAPEMIVVHYDASPRDDGAVLWMQSPGSRVSAHFHVGRDGRTRQLVSIERAAWHAGASIAPGMHGGADDGDVNARSIGIEIGNLGRVASRNGEWVYDVAGAEWRYPLDSLHDPAWGRLRYSTGRVICGHWEPYTGPAIYALARLVDDIRAAYGPLPMYGHEEIAQPLGRKMDPGPLFPWDAFDRMGDWRKTWSGEEEQSGATE